MKTYEATVERDGKWWMISIPEIDGLTQARSLAEADKMARSLVAITLDEDPSTFDVRLTIPTVGDVDVSRQLETIANLREHATQDEKQATANAKHLAKTLSAQGITVRDIGTLMGVTFQRAHQLTVA